MVFNRRTKSFEVETSRVYTLPSAYSAHLIYFHSYAYVDRTMSLYSILKKTLVLHTYKTTHTQHNSKDYSNSPQQIIQ